MKSPQKARQPMRFGKVALATVVLVVGMAGCEALTANRLEAQIERDMAALRKLGLPAAPEELKRASDVEPNAAPLYREALGEWSKLGVRRPQNPPLVKDISEDKGYSDEMRTYVSQCDSVLKKVLLASAMANRVTDRERGWVVANEFREMAFFKEFGVLASTKAALAAEDGNFKETFKWLRVAQRVGFHAREPGLIGASINGAVDAIVQRQLQILIRLHHRSPEFMAEAGAFLESQDKLANAYDLIEGAIGDMARPLPLPIGKKRVHAEIYRRLRRGAEIVAPNPQDAELGAKAIAAIMEGLPRGKASESILKTVLSPVRQVTALTLGPIDLAADSFLTSEARRRVTRQGYELYAQLLAKGSFPLKLDSSTKWSSDPFTGKPLCYIPRLKAFVLHSVGKNRTNDGGLLGSQTQDIVYYFPMKVLSEAR